MTEKRFKVVVYDENVINGFAVLDLHKPNISKRLKYENVYIGSKEGCEIVCNFGNSLADENEQLKQSNERIVKDIDLALGFIRHKGYSLQDIKDYEDAKKEYEEDLAYYRNGDVE